MGFILKFEDYVNKLILKQIEKFKNSHFMAFLRRIGNFFYRHFLLLKALLYKVIRYPYRETFTSKMPSSFKEFLTLIIKWIFLKLSSIKPERIAISFILFGIFATGAVGVYSNSKKIYEQTEVTRNPASAEVEIYKEQSPYYLLEKKMAVIEAFKVPTLVKNIHSIQNITMDFNVISSNRFIALYLRSHVDELKDFLVLGFEPIDSSFAMNEEGKNIIKEKIMTLIMEFLRDKEIEGSIDDVQITYLIAT